MKTLIQKLLPGLALFATLAAHAANVTVSDSIVALATNGTKLYTFTDPGSGQSATVALTITPFSPDPLATLVALDGDTRIGVGNTNVGGDGNLIANGEGVTFSATIASATFGVVPSSIQFRIAGLGLRAVDGTSTLYWMSSATASNNFSLSSEAVNALDSTLAPLNGTNYSARLDWAANTGNNYQLSDAGGIAGLGLVLNATFSITNSNDPRTNSWFTANSTKLARIYTTDANKTNGVTVTTWSNGQQTQATPTYAGVQEIYSSASWVYIRSTGLGGHIMGPWYNDVARTVAFVNMPANQKAFYRFPRTPVVPGTKVTTGGEIGYMVDGVKMFDSRDAVSYINSTGQDGSPPGAGTTGDGIWNRDAYVNESTTFDTSLAHQQNTGVYHYHASPLALRYLLGDNVDFNPVSKAYTANTNAPVKHSPIIAWANDGHPIYGPFGYASATNAATGVRRMVSGFVLRNGANGTTNLIVTGRTSLAAWAQRAQNRTNLTASQYGPTNFTSFPLGRYVEDNDYLGDLGQVQGVGFDLDEFNGRFCVTPEFPGGCYAYFNTISASGAPAYPYNVGRQYYGSPTAGTVTTLSESVTTNFVGGPSTREVLNAPAVSGGIVVLTWSAVEGGTYRVESTTNLATWTTNATGVAPLANVGSNTNTSPDSARYYRVNRSALATYDPVSGTGGGGGGSVAPGGSATRGTTVTVTITLPISPPQPPANMVPTSVTLAGTIVGTSISRPAQGTVISTFAIPAGAPTNAQNIVVTFNPAPTYTMTGAFTINP